MHRYRFVLGLGLLLVASACANNELGRAVPECEGDLTGSMVIQIQAVPTAEFVPCINDLKLGWDYVDLVPKLGESRFWLSSDRSGDRFLEVALTDSCRADPPGQHVEVRPGVDQYRDVTVVPARVSIVIAPASSREAEYAEAVEAFLEAQEIEGRRVVASYDQKDRPLADKISDAHERGWVLVAIEEQDQLNDPPTVGLALPGESSLRRAVSVLRLPAILDNHLDQPSYRGTWVTVFDGGCITYRFDAKGPEVGSLVEDVTASLDLFPSRQLQRDLREAGVIG